jgi:hypothetical protein
MIGYQCRYISNDSDSVFENELQFKFQGFNPKLAKMVFMLSS